MELLISHGADVNLRNPLGESPLDLLDAYEPRPIGDRDAQRIRSALLKAGAREDLSTLVRAGDISHLRQMFEGDPSLARADSELGGPLFVAARSGRTEVVRLLLEFGADPNKTNGAKNTPLWFACQSPATAADRIEVAKMLIDAGADVHRICEDGSTALHFAAWRGPVEMVELLLSHNAQKAVKDAHGRLPIDRARENGTPDSAKIVEILSDTSTLGAFLDAAVPRPESNHKAGSCAAAEKVLAEHPEIPTSSIFAAAVLADQNELRRWIGLDASWAIRRGGPRDWSPLLYLCFSRFLRDRRRSEGEFAACVGLLLSHGADANDYFADPNDPALRETALYGAAGIANSATVASSLLEAGAGVINPPEHEALYHAAEFSDNAALRVLLEAGPDAESVSYCLCHKMDMEDPAGVRLFIQHGADVNHLLRRGLFEGYRPLHFALFRRRSREIFELLLAAGADPNLSGKDSLTPSALAYRQGRMDIAELFREHGASDPTDLKTRYLAALSSGDAAAHLEILRDHSRLPEKLDETDYHLLVDAAEAGNLPAVRLMLDVGFPIQTRGTSYGGWDGTALDNAAWGGHVEIVKLLLERGADPRSKHSFGGDALGAAIHGASHARHGRGLAVVEAIASRYEPGELESYATYAATESSAEIADLLRRRAGK